MPVGEEAAKVYLTNLYNHTMPLIRYELTDQVRVLAEPCPCGSAYATIADLSGRLDDWFDYGGVAVHPHLFRSPLSLRPQIVEYQVRQTTTGAEVAVRVAAEVDVASLVADLCVALQRAGLPDPRVVVGVVDELPRGRTGKLSRFAPLRPKAEPYDCNTSDG